MCAGLDPKVSSQRRMDFARESCELQKLERRLAEKRPGGIPRRRIYDAKARALDLWRREQIIKPRYDKKLSLLVKHAILAYGELECRSLCTTLSQNRFVEIRRNIFSNLIHDEVSDSGGEVSFCPGVTLYGVKKRESWWTRSFLGALCYDLLFDMWFEEAIFIVNGLEGLHSLDHHSGELLRLDYFRNGLIMLDILQNIEIIVTDHLWDTNPDSAGNLPADETSRLDELYELLQPLRWLNLRTNIDIVFDIPVSDPSGKDLESLRLMVEKMYPLFMDLVQSRLTLKLIIGTVELIPRRFRLRRRGQIEEGTKKNPETAPETVPESTPEAIPGPSSEPNPGSTSEPTSGSAPEGTTAETVPTAPPNQISPENCFSSANKLFEALSHHRKAQFDEIKASGSIFTKEGGLSEPQVD